MGYLSKDGQLAKRMREKMEFRRAKKTCLKIVARLKKSKTAQVIVRYHLNPAMVGILESEGFGIWKDDSITVISVYARERISPKNNHKLVPEVEPLDVW